MVKQNFSAFVVRETSPGHFVGAIEQRTIKDLPPGEVLLQVRYSSLNYKDALSASGNRGVTKCYPHTPGIDAAGVVISSSSPLVKCGDDVICMGYDLGMNTAGGLGQFIRVPASWVVKKPDSISLLQAMQIGTAGFTAAQSVLALMDNSVTPEKGEILVTGSSGGVGSIATHLLSELGFRVTALTSKERVQEYLLSLGAKTVLSPKVLLEDRHKFLLSERWAGVIDTVGGDVLSTAIKGLHFDGVATCCGNAASAELILTVYPFILRGVHLIGIYSANCPREKRLKVWQKLAAEWQLPMLKDMSRTISLSGVSREVDAMLAGKTIGRCVVDLWEEM